MDGTTGRVLLHLVPGLEVPRERVKRRDGRGTRSTYAKHSECEFSSTSSFDFRDSFSSRLLASGDQAKSGRHTSNDPSHDRPRSPNYFGGLVTSSILRSRKQQLETATERVRMFENAAMNTDLLLTAVQAEMLASVVERDQV